MTKDIDVTGLGDLMIDFSYAGEDECGRALFARNPAGSMANVLCQVARLGGAGMLVTTLGNDVHSRYLYNTVQQGVGLQLCPAGYLLHHLWDAPNKIYVRIP